LPFLAHIQNARRAWTQQPLVGVSGHEVRVLERRRKRAGRLDPVHTKRDTPFPQPAADRFYLQSPAAHETAGRQRNEARILINLALDVHRANAAQLLRADEANLNALVGQRGPWVDVR